MKILDCTLRDGGYINNWRFNEDFIKNLSEQLELCNVDLVEIGFINKTNNYRNKIVGNTRILTENDINNFKKFNFKKAVMADFSDINNDILKKKIDIDLIRVAFHKKDLKSALEKCKEIKELGYSVSANAMAVTNYNKEDLIYLIEKINEYKIDVLYVADSFGSLLNKDIKYYFKFLDEKLNKNINLGFHLHNNMNNAYSNYECLKNLMTKSDRNVIIDTTIFGMGRGAGNLQTELVLKDYINYEKIYNFIIFIQDYIKPIYKNDENTWGYDLDYFLSGLIKMHPNYVVKMRDFTIEMKKRLFLINVIKKRNYDYSFFDLSIINNLIEEYKPQLL
jgi:4-hydroxy 2-oxovalerate aldolase